MISFGLCQGFLGQCPFVLWPPGVTTAPLFTCLTYSWSGKARDDPEGLEAKLSADVAADTSGSQGARSIPGAKPPTTSSQLLDKQ